MRKLLTFLQAVAISTLIAGCDGTGTETEPEITFEDANFKAYLVANFDTDRDGEISQMEASAPRTSHPSLELNI